MSMSAKIRRAPLRIATGAYIVNSGVSRLTADDDTAKSLHGMASGAYPLVGKVEPKTFATALAVGEIAVGSTLLLPIVPPVLAGAALVGFSGALLNMYWHTPGMHREGSIRPTPQGLPVAKDVWMVGIGLGLMADAALEPAHDRVVELEASVSQRRTDRSRSARRKAKKSARKAKRRSTELLDTMLDRAQHASKTAAARLDDVRSDYAPAAKDKARAARDAARQAAEEYGPVAKDKARKARDAARHAAEEYGPIAADKARQARDAARQAAEEYGPVAKDKARQARDAARQAAEEYGPVAADKARTARYAAKEYGAKAQKYASKVREKVS